MLGWEFPPYLNGGLGVATVGLAQALAPLNDLTLLVPRSNSSYRAEGYRLLTMHGQSISAVKATYLERETEYLKEVKVEYLPIDISGYERIERRYDAVEKEHWLKVERFVEHEEEISPAKYFFFDQPYGSNLVQKVLDYTEMAMAHSEGWDFDIIHAHDWMTFLLGMELKARTGKPLVLHVHSLEYDRGGPESRNWIFELELHATQVADAIIPVSAYTADILKEIYGAKADKLHPISNGIEPFEGYRKEAPFPEPLITFLGRITHQKGPAFFLEMAKYLLGKRPELRFAIAGRGEQIEQLIEQTAAARLGNRIHFTGHLETDPVRNLLAMTDVYVLPSVSEPFGLSALEAAQMQVPCVISQNSGVAEVLPSALIADYADSQALGDRILELLDNESLRQQVVAGQLEDLKSVGWPRAARQVTALYQKLSN